MKLIKENKQKRRQVWEYDDYFRKQWLFNDERWLKEHYEILKKIAPDEYLKGWGTSNNTMWIDTNKIEGELASTFEHTPDFVKKIENFCLDHYYTKTKPYAHGDWVLSNMIIKDDEISLIDWDNCGIYPEPQILHKMQLDLKSAFGDKI